MENRYLLYVDLLGFSNLVQHRSSLLPNIFEALDNSNIHTHPGSFGVIQFSDTLIVYNEYDIDSHHEKKMCVMFLCEFAQEIQLRLLNRDLFIRAFITYGSFEDTGPYPNPNYTHIRAFWGESLITAYQTEKTIQAVGLFVDDSIKPLLLTDLYQPDLYDQQKKIWFVDTSRMLSDQFFDGTDFSYAELNVTSQGMEYLLAYDLYYLKKLFEHGHDLNLPPTVRTKYLTTWGFYRKNYKGLCSALEDSDFDYESILDINLKPFMEEIGTPNSRFW